MELVETIQAFLELAAEDPRIGPLHMTLYMAICQCWAEQDYPESVRIDRAVLMAKAKIASTNSYHRVIRELHRYRYIRYEPSFDPEVGSRVGV
jgi:hypothetical protein